LEDWLAQALELGDWLAMPLGMAEVLAQALKLVNWLAQALGMAEVLAEQMAVCRQLKPEPATQRSI
jgi:hypothetical protein